jgi:hypothetical protein
VDGVVTATQTTPGNFLHFDAVGLGGGGGCHVLATPPAGKAIVLKQIELDVFAKPRPREGQTVEVLTGTTCSVLKLISDVNPSTIGVTELPFDPGVGVPAGSGVSIVVSGWVQAEAYGFGYAVQSSAVPPSAARAQAPAPPRLQQQ